MHVRHAHSHLHAHLHSHSHVHVHLHVYLHLHAHVHLHANTHAHANTDTGRASRSARSTNETFLLPDEERGRILRIIPDEASWQEPRNYGSVVTM